MALYGPTRTSADRGLPRHNQGDDGAPAANGSSSGRKRPGRTVTVEVARRIQSRRVQLGLTQAQAAKKARISPTTWNRLETRQATQFRYVTLTAIATALNLDPDTFTLPTPPPRSALSLGAESASGDQAQPLPLRSPPQPPAPPTPRVGEVRIVGDTTPPEQHSPENRLAAMERRLATLERRLATDTSLATEPPPRDPDLLRRYWGQRLRAARERAELSVNKLAHQIGVGPNTIYGWEAGRRALETKHVLALATALRVQVADLFPYPLLDFADDSPA